MKVFTPLREAGYEFAHPVESDDFETLTVQIDGAHRGSSWVPVRMKLVVEDEQGQPLRESDAPWLGVHALVLRPRAILALKPLLLAHGELLPLSCAQARLEVFNPTHVIEALDEAASTVWRFPEDGRIFNIKKPVFRREAIQGLQIFKLTGLRASCTYVREEFVEQWERAGLRGLTFEQVWEG